MEKILCGLLIIGFNFFLLIVVLMVIINDLMFFFLRICEGFVREGLLLVVSRMRIFEMDFWVFFSSEEDFFKVLEMLCLLDMYCKLFILLEMVFLFVEDEKCFMFGLFL